MPEKAEEVEDDASEASKVNDAKPLNKEAKKEKDVEVLIKNPEKIRQSIREDEKDGANDASKEDKSVSKEANEENVNTLSIKAKTRAEQGSSAGVLDSVRSDPEITGAGAKALSS